MCRRSTRTWQASIRLRGRTHVCYIFFTYLNSFSLFIHFQSKINKLITKLFTGRGKQRASGTKIRKIGLCSECRRLFNESKIDKKTVKISMNFGPKHRNRKSYYLPGTPPDIWNPVISVSPKKGRATPVKSQEEF